RLRQSETHDGVSIAGGISLAVRRLIPLRRPRPDAGYVTRAGCTHIVSRIRCSRSGYGALTVAGIMPLLGRPLLKRYFLWPWPWWLPPSSTRMAVAGYMVPRADPQHPGQYLPAWDGQPSDWPWVLRQWDRIATAGA